MCVHVPAGNVQCSRAETLYAECLTNQETFDTLTLERFVDTAGRHKSGAWVSELHDRYLSWAKIDAMSRA